MQTPSTRGGFAAFTERAKDVFVNALRDYFGDLVNKNVITEKPIIERYGLAAQSPKESFLQIVTAMPHEKQRIPTIAVMSAPGTERKLGIGRQVVATYHHPTDGRPMVREMVGGDMIVVLEISSVDTNVRSDIVDLVMSFFTLYMEDTRFSFLGDTNPDKITGVNANYQIILKAQASIQGETDMARPGGEQQGRIYLNRISVPIIFIDYVDREAFDIDVCFDPTLTPEDDTMLPTSGIIPEFGQMQFVTTDDFEAQSGIDATRWSVRTSPTTNATLVATPTIKGNGSVLVTSFAAGLGIAVITNRQNAGVLSGRVRTRFQLRDPFSCVVLYAMLQGPDPMVDPSYWLLVQPGSPARLGLFKGPIQVGAIPLVQGSRVVVVSGISLAAQLEWKIDPTTSRIRLRGFISSCQTSDFGSLHNRLEFIDGSSAFLTSQGEGVGYVDQPGHASSLLLDDPAIINEIAGVPFVNPSRARIR